MGGSGSEYDGGSSIVQGSGSGSGSGSGYDVLRIRRIYLYAVSSPS